MAPRHPIPPVKCSGHKRDGTPCRKWAIPGTVVCKLHGGGAPQVQGKAATRSTLAVLIQRDPRHPWQVVLDATHIGDSLMKDCEEPLRRGESLTAEQIDRLVESTRLAHHLAKTAIDTRAHEHLAEQVQRDVELEGQVVAATLGRVLDALLGGLGLPVTHLQRTRAWVFEAAQLVLSNLDAASSADGVIIPPLPLNDLTFVVADRSALLTAQMYSTVAGSPTVGRQPSGDASASEDESSATSGNLAPVPASEPLDAEVVDDEPPSPTPLRGWSPSGTPNAWGRGGSELTRGIG